MQSNPPALMRQLSRTHAKGTKHGCARWLSSSHEIHVRTQLDEKHSRLNWIAAAPGVLRKRAAATSIRFLHAPLTIPRNPRPGLSPRTTQRLGKFLGWKRLVPSLAKLSPHKRGRGRAKWLRPLRLSSASQMKHFNFYGAAVLTVSVGGPELKAGQKELDRNGPHRRTLYCWLTIIAVVDQGSEFTGALISCLCDRGLDRSRQQSMAHYRAADLIRSEV